MLDAADMGVVGGDFTDRFCVPSNLASCLDGDCGVDSAFSFTFTESEFNDFADDECDCSGFWSDDHSPSIELLFFRCAFSGALSPCCSFWDCFSWDDGAFVDVFSLDLVLSSSSLDLDGDRIPTLLLLPDDACDAAKRKFSFKLIYFHSLKDEKKKICQFLQVCLTLSVSNWY